MKFKSRGIIAENGEVLVQRILVIGDTHIPDRAEKIPGSLRELIESNRPWDIVVFTGDLTGREVLSWVYTLGPRVYIVRGNMDYMPLPKTQVFSIEGLTIGVHHGDGIHPRGDPLKLSAIASRMGVDVLLTGHTHSDFVKTSPNGKVLLVNPGSLTGVWGGGGGSYTPSFAELLVESNRVKTVVYRLHGGRILRLEVVAEKSPSGWILSPYS